MKCVLKTVWQTGCTHCCYPSGTQVLEFTAPHKMGLRTDVRSITYLNAFFIPYSGMCAKRMVPLGESVPPMNSEGLNLPLGACQGIAVCQLTQAQQPAWLQLLWANLKASLNHQESVIYAGSSSASIKTWAVFRGGWVGRGREEKR